MSGAEQGARTWTGREIVLETFVREGVRHIFGNPGTTELPLLDALGRYPSLQYVLALQEAVAVSMADAYAQLTGRVAVANLHVAPGLGNAMGSLYNAWEGRTPLLVTAGQQDSRYRLREPVLWHDLVAMAEPVTKWSVEARSADELPELMSRAFKVAMDPPTGPVFVSLPLDVMIQTTLHSPRDPSRLFRRTVPDPEGVEEAVRLLLAAERPVVFCGDQVARSGAVDVLVRLAEAIGANVYGDILPVHVDFPNMHPAWRSRGFGDHAQIREAVGDADCVLLVGGEFFEEVWYVDVEPFPPQASIIQIDSAPSGLGRNYRLDCGLLADPRYALEALLGRLEEKADSQWRARARARLAAMGELKARELAGQEARVARTAGNRPMASARLMHELARALPPGTMVAREAITADADLNRSFEFRAPGDFIGARGGGIGQGLPGGIAAKLACPERPVLCISGDGSSLYTIQALWSAAHHRIPVVFVILHNATYRILKYNLRRFRSLVGEEAGEGWPHLDLDDPDIDYGAVARGFGLESRRVVDPEEVGPAVRDAFASGRPWRRPRWRPPDSAPGDTPVGASPGALGRDLGRPLERGRPRSHSGRASPSRSSRPRCPRSAGGLAQRVGRAGPGWSPARLPPAGRAAQPRLHPEARDDARRARAAGPGVPLGDRLSGDRPAFGGATARRSDRAGRGGPVARGRTAVAGAGPPAQPGAPGRGGRSRARHEPLRDLGASSGCLRRATVPGLQREPVGTPRELRGGGARDLEQRTPGGGGGPCAAPR